MASGSQFFDQATEFHIDHGWVAGVRQLASPNYNSRPFANSRAYNNVRPHDNSRSHDNCDADDHDLSHQNVPLPLIDLLVIHNISLPAGEFGGPYIDQLFLNTLDCTVHDSFADLRDLKVSAHFLLTRDGDITQCVATDKRAWHAGTSRFGERDNCNDFSIGIELEGSDTTPFTDEQYAALQWLVRGLMRYYPQINVERIVGHSDIAPGRKTDPGPCFDWSRLKQGLIQGSTD